jgi:hypothetical protein
MNATVKLLNPRSPDTKYVGTEPTWAVQPLTGRITAMSRAFNWYNYFYGKKDAKDFVAAYLDSTNRSRDAKKIRQLNDSQVRLTTGWLCRMATVGLELTEQETDNLKVMIGDLLAIKSEPVAAVAAEPETPRVTIQDRLREKVSECAGELDALFDDFLASGARMTADWKPIATIRGMNVAPQLIHVILDIWKRRLVEFETVQAGKDAQLTEAYSYLSKIQLRNVIKFCEAVINDCGAYVQIKKVERKPRKVKPVTPEKQAAKFKICVEFAELKLQSLPAAQLVDKSEAWLYDSKKRKLIHLVADEYAKTFTVKANAVIGFSTAATVQKTLRKPADTLRAIQSGGKPTCRKVFKDIKATETAWNGRGNEHLIVLKTW